MDKVEDRETEFNCYEPLFKQALPRKLRDSAKK
jgi:hypothetical protein